MGQPADGEGAPATVVTEAYSAARELLQRAEEDAARIRADADRYVQRRHQEAELVVSKARRVLAIAEERAAAIDAGGVRPAPVAVPATPAAIDLTDLTAAAHEPEPAPAPRPGSTALDAILASAVSRAVERALPSDR